MGLILFLIVAGILIPLGIAAAIIAKIASFREVRQQLNELSIQMDRHIEDARSLHRMYDEAGHEKPRPAGGC
jgi:hypothetical protein